MIRLTHGACTHVGQVRRDNEDAYVAVDGLYIVADGMGGHSAGEVASAITVATLTDAFTSVNPGLHSPEQVAEAIAQANTAVFIEALDDSAKSGMGTTLTGLVVTDPERHHVVVANVGDSRTYLWRGGKLQQITTDHSHVQTLVDRGAITKAEARVHYQRNIVLRAVGIDADVQVDLFPLTVENGDRFVVCSDGLVDEADDDEIVNEIKLCPAPQDLAERLVQLANANGGRDNITVIVVDIATTNASPTDDTAPTRTTAGDPVTTSGDAIARDTSSIAPASTRGSMFVAVLGTVALISALLVGIISAL
ncbi:MAG: Stp1/IreP family PP2C-type Ser/Thr phosphatase [Ilumatobacteraceae bacterium]